MRILYVSQHFAPEMGAPSVRVRELARHLTLRGHEMTVLTAFPNHPAGRLFPGYRSRYLRFASLETLDGFRVVRTAHFIRPNQGALNRIVSYPSFAVSAALTSTFMRPFDAVIGTTPPLLAPFAAWWRTRLPWRPFVLEVRDLWPESVVATGHGGAGSASVRALALAARFLYRRSDRIVSVTPAIRDFLIEHHGVRPDKIDVVMAGVDADAFNPAVPTAGFKEKLGLHGKFVVSYVGTLGKAHGLDILLEAARALRDRAPDVVFLLAGDGAERAALEGSVSRGDTPNVRLLPPQPFAAIPGILAASDVCLVLLRDDPLFRTVLPTKTLEYMAAGRPVICNVPGQAAQVVAGSGGGLNVPPGDATALTDAILRLKIDIELRHSLGAAGRRYAGEHASWQSRAAAYEDVLRRAVSERTDNGRAGLRLPLVSSGSRKGENKAPG